MGRAGEADVFHVDLSPNPGREDEARAWLDERERARRDRFISPGPRRRFTLCRAALRSVLCRELGCGNDELEFGSGYYEKPFAIVRGERRPTGFNVSHSGRHGLIAVASGGRVGVDVEELDPRRNLDTLIDSAFTAAERGDLDLVEGLQKRRLFFRLWTIKEALIKGTGMGLALNMSTFEVPAAMRRGAASATFSFPQAPSVRWRLESLEGEGFSGAVAYATA